MASPVQTTLGRDLSLEIPPPSSTPTSNSDLTTLTALVQDFRPIHTPPTGDPSLFQCTFHDATILGYNNFTGITCATRADLRGLIHLDLDNPQAAEFINSRVPGHLDRIRQTSGIAGHLALNNQQTTSPPFTPPATRVHTPPARHDSPNPLPTPPPKPPPHAQHLVYLTMPNLPSEDEPIPPPPTKLVAAYFRRNKRLTYRDPMTFGSSPGLHLHAPHEDGLYEYWPHEQTFLLKIARYFEGREDLRDGIVIPDEFRGGEYLEGIGEGTRVSLRLPIIEDLLARASRTWPGTIFSIFNNAELSAPTPSTPIQRKNVNYHFISVTPTTEDDELSSTDEDWIYPPTPPRFPSLELSVTRQLEDLHADDSPPPGLIDNTTGEVEIMRVELEPAPVMLDQTNDNGSSPPALEYAEEETLRNENSDEIVRPSLIPGIIIQAASSPPSLQSTSSSDLSSAPTSERHLSPREDLPIEVPPIEVMEDQLSDEEERPPRTFATQIEVSNYHMAHPRSYLQRLLEVTLRRSLGKVMANLVPVTSIRFGSRISPRSTTKWAELIPPSQFHQFFPEHKNYAELERLISSKRANSGRIPNRWQTQLTRIRRLRHLIYQVIQDAEHLATNYGFAYGLRNFAVGLDYWYAGLTTNGLLHPREARYFYVLDIFLTQIRVIDLAANTRQILYARFDNPRDLWTLVHAVVNRLDPPADHFDLDIPPASARKDSTRAFQPAELDELDAVVA